MRCQRIVLAGLKVKIKNGRNMRKTKVIHPIFNRNSSDIRENGRKVMKFILIVHENQKVRAKNSRNEEDSHQMPVETLKRVGKRAKMSEKIEFSPYHPTEVRRMQMWL